MNSFRIQAFVFVMNKIKMLKRFIRRGRMYILYIYEKCHEMLKNSHAIFQCVELLGYCETCNDL